MQTIDLSHFLKSGMPVYPGTEPPVIKEACTIVSNGFSERHISMFSHTGTHIDFPAHIFPAGKSLSDYSTDYFIGKALKFNLYPSRELNIGEIKQRISVMGSPDFILFSGGWDKYWNSPDYFHGFPLPDKKLIEYVGSLGIRGIGIDCISIDSIDSTQLENHRLILSQGLIIIENLTYLHKLPDQLFDFICLPLKIEYGDGSPVRAVAIIK